MPSSASSTPRASGGGGSGGSQHTPPLPPASHGNGQGQGHGGDGGGGRGGEHVRLMCSFGGRILPRPGDHQLRYVGGETRIVSVPRAATFDVLVAALAKVAPALFPPSGPGPALRYQLPQDDLDALISINSDDDVDSLIEEIDRFQVLAAAAAALKPPRLRLFLFASSPDHSSAGAGDASSDQWFVGALNAPAMAPIERGRSEASSIISEVPDYLFGLDTTSDEPSPGPGGARLKVDTEMAHGEDDAPVTARGGAPPTPHVTETAPWPVPPPPYITQQVYYVPVCPVHYLDPSSQGGYMGSSLPHCRWRRKRRAGRSLLNHRRLRRRLRRPALHAAVPADDVRARAAARLGGLLVGGEAAGGRWGPRRVGASGGRQSTARMSGSLELSWS